MKKRLSDKYLIAKLKKAIIAEEIAGSFYNYIANRIQNTHAKDKFKKFAKEEAVEHKYLLNNRLKEITGKTFEPDITLVEVDIKINWFSLPGALKRAKDSEAAAVKFYKKARRWDNKEYAGMYDDIIEDERNHWFYIEQEKLLIQPVPKYTDKVGLRLFSILKDIFKTDATDARRKYENG